MGQPVAALSSGRVGTLSGNGVVCDPKRSSILTSTAQEPCPIIGDCSMLDKAASALAHLTALE